MNIRRLMLLAACTLALPLTAAAQRDFDKVELRITKVSGTVYMIDAAKGNAGGNIAASVGEDGIVIVDDQFAPLAGKIRAALKSVTEKPVRFVINTHYHGDHTGGNGVFQQEAPVLAQENVRKRLAAGGTAGNGGSLRMPNKPAAKEALPIITFEHDVSVHLNGEDIRALYVPGGHTDTDAVIYFAQSNVVHMGDDFVTYGFPFIDVDAGGSIDGLIAGVETAVASLPNDVKVIPGHGKVSSLDDVRAYVKLLKETRAAVQKALDDHLTLAQMKEKKILEAWKQYSGDFVSTDIYLESVYNSLTGQAAGKFVPHN